MTRRRKKRPLVPTTWVEWSPGFADIFRLAPADWTPPRKVRISAGRTHNTLTARYVTHTGAISTVSVRLEHIEGRWSVTAESFRQMLVAGPRL